MGDGVARGHPGNEGGEAGLDAHRGTGEDLDHDGDGEVCDDEGDQIGKGRWSGHRGRRRLEQPDTASLIGDDLLIVAAVKGEVREGGGSFDMVRGAAVVWTAVTQDQT